MRFIAMFITAVYVLKKKSIYDIVNDKILAPGDKWSEVKWQKHKGKSKGKGLSSK